jgi:hypothetical protein
MDYSDQKINPSLISLLLSHADGSYSKMLQHHQSTHDREENTARLVLSHLIKFETVSRKLCVKNINLPAYIIRNKKHIIGDFYDRHPLFAITPLKTVLHQVFVDSEIHAEVDTCSGGILCDHLTDDEIAAVLLAQKYNIQHKEDMFVEKKQVNILWFEFLTSLYRIMFTSNINFENINTAVAVSFTDGGATIQALEGIFIFLPKYQKTSNLLMARLKTECWKSVECDLLIEANNFNDKSNKLLMAGNNRTDNQCLNGFDSVSSECLSVLYTLRRRMVPA